MTESGIVSRIKDLMKAAKISRYKLAEVTGVPYTTLTGILVGRVKDPQVNTLEAIAQYFNVSVDYFLGPGWDEQGTDTFGSTLSKLRKAKGLSVTELARESGVSHPHISQMESGKRGAPSPATLNKLAGPLGVSYSELMIAAGHSEDAPPDLKAMLEYGPRFMYNGHELTAQDRKRILTVLEALFPEYGG